MALCYPGKGSSGDKAPPAICAKTHHADILKSLPNIELTLLIARMRRNIIVKMILKTYQNV